MCQAKATTRDVGFAIRDFLEDKSFHLFVDVKGEIEETRNSREIEFVDVSDPHNPLVVLDNGQSFRIRIFAEG